MVNRRICVVVGAVIACVHRVAQLVIHADLIAVIVEVIAKRLARNFISNQRIETMDGVDSAEWTERGVLMDVTLEKKNGQTTIKTAQAHPTWVNRTPKGTTSPEGYPLYTYQTYILEDFIKGGKYRNKLDEETKERIDTAYKEMNAHVNLKWK